jgi:hypothetical protein
MTLLIESTKKGTEPSRKRLPVKRSVSFAKVNQYHSDVSDNDAILQCRDKRRRYQRRGSKTPAMLLLSKTDLSKIQEKFFPNDSTTYANTAKNATYTVSSDDKYCCTSKNNTPQRRMSNVLSDAGSIQQRRMSIISSLRESLELNCTMFVGGEATSTTPVCTTPTTTTTASVIRRRLSFDLTMQAATTVCTIPWGV